MQGIILSDGLDLLTVESEDGITWKVVEDDTRDNRSIRDCGGIDNWSDHSASGRSHGQ